MTRIPHRGRAPAVPSRPIRILSCRIDDDDNHVLTIEFPSSSGGLGTCTLPRELLANPQQLRRELAGKGALLQGEISEVARRMLASPVPVTSRVTKRSGWHGGQFVSKYGVFGPKSSVAVTFDPSMVGNGRLKKGDCATYLAGLKPLLLASDQLLLAYLLGLAAPLYSCLSIRGGFAVCLSQQSSTGKTLCLRLAQSIYGRADEADLENFGNTSGIILNRLPAYGGTCVSFGDVKADLNVSAAVEKLGILAFNASGGTVRQRLNEPSRPEPSFFIPLLSAERPLREMFAEVGRRFEDGEAVRLLDVPVAPRSEGGIFSRASTRPSADWVADLERFLAGNHGTMIWRWAMKLAGAKEIVLRRKVDAAEALFLSSCMAVEAHHRRIAAIFAKLYATTILALEFSVLELTDAEILSATNRLLWSVISNLGHGDGDLSNRWRLLFNMLVDQTEFPVVREGDTIPAGARGFRRDGLICIARQELSVLAGGDRNLDGIVLPQLRRTRVLRLTKAGELTAPIKIGRRRSRFYRLQEASLTAARVEIVGSENRSS